MGQQHSPAFRLTRVGTMNVAGQGVPPVQHLRTPKAGQAGRPVLPEVHGKKTAAS